MIIKKHFNNLTKSLNHQKEGINNTSRRDSNHQIEIIIKMNKIQNKIVRLHPHQTVH